MATTFAAAKATHAVSSGLRRRNSITRMPDRLDPVVVPELVAKPADADVDHVRPRVEVIAPYRREDAVAAHHLARVGEEQVQQPELAVGEEGGPGPHPRLASRDVERDAPRSHPLLVPVRVRSELHPDARQ